MRIRTKVCGLTTVTNALDVVSTGVDAIGLVFYEKSPRNVSIQQAATIIDSLPPFITTVGLFLDAPEKQVQSVLDQVPLDLLQFHGEEKPAYCTSFSRPYIKAIGMKGWVDFNLIINAYPDAQGFLLDSHAAGKAGGTGEAFDWNKIPSSDRPLILAGGLNPSNVAVALSQAKHAGKSLYAVDVSSGVESSAGMKDITKIQHFLLNIAKG